MHSFARAIQRHLPSLHFPMSHRGIRHPGKQSLSAKIYTDCSVLLDPCGLRSLLLMMVGDGGGDGSYISTRGCKRWSETDGLSVKWRHGFGLSLSSPECPSVLSCSVLPCSRRYVSVDKGTRLHKAGGLQKTGLGGIKQTHPMTAGRGTLKSGR